MSIIKSVTLEEEIKKNPQLKLSDVQLLKEWCKKQSHLPKVEDSFLALFLHSNYYQIEPTKITIENYYTIRTHLPEIFCNRDPLTEKELRQIFKDIALIRLNGTTKEGYKIIYGKLVNTDSSHYVFTAHLKYSMMLLDLCFLMDGTNNGYTFIADGSKISFGHATRMNPLLLKKSLHYIQEAAPIRLKGLHYINVSPAAEFIMNLAKPFMKKEIIDLIHFHSSLETVPEYIPINLLPNEEGGKAGSIQELSDMQVKTLEEYREWFLLDETTRRVNEALRIEQKTLPNTLFGIEGSFKKLDID